MPGLLAQESQAAAMGAPSGMPPSGGGPAGLTQGQGPPPPAALGGQQPAGAAPQGQPTPGFEQHMSKAMEILVQGNPADAAIVGQFFAQIQALDEGHRGQQGQGPQQAAPPMGAAPPGPVIP